MKSTVNTRDDGKSQAPSTVVVQPSISDTAIFRGVKEFVEIKFALFSIPVSKSGLPIIGNTIGAVPTVVFGVAEHIEKGSSCWAAIVDISADVTQGILLPIPMQVALKISELAAAESKNTIKYMESFQQVHDLDPSVEFERWSERGLIHAIGLPSQAITWFKKVLTDMPLRIRGFSSSPDQDTLSKDSSSQVSMHLKELDLPEDGFLAFAQNIDAALLQQGSAGAPWGTSNVFSRVEGYRRELQFLPQIQSFSDPSQANYHEIASIGNPNQMLTFRVGSDSPILCPEFQAFLTELNEASPLSCVEQPIELSADVPSEAVLMQSKQKSSHTKIEKTQVKEPLITDMRIGVVGSGIGIIATLAGQGTISFTAGKAGFLISVSANFGPGFWTALGTATGVGAVVAGVVITAQYFYRQHVQHIQHRLNASIKNTRKDVQFISEKLQQLQFINPSNFEQLNKETQGLISHLSGKIEKEQKRARYAQQHKDLKSRNAHHAISRDYHNTIGDLSQLQKSFLLEQVQESFVETHKDKTSGEIIKIAKEMLNKSSYNPEDISKIQGLRQVIVDKVLRLSQSGQIDEAQILLKETSHLQYHLPGNIEELSFGDGMGEIDKNTKGDIETINMKIIEINKHIGAGGDPREALEGLKMHIFRAQRNWNRRNEGRDKIDKKSSSYVTGKQWSERIKTLKKLFSNLQTKIEYYGDGNNPKNLQLEGWYSVVEKLFYNADKPVSFWLQELKQVSDSNDDAKVKENILIKDYARERILNVFLNGIIGGDFELTEAILEKYKQVNADDDELVSTFSALQDDAMQYKEQPISFWINQAQEIHQVSLEKRTMKQMFLSRVSLQKIHGEIASKLLSGKFNEVEELLSELNQALPETAAQLSVYVSIIESYKGCEKERVDFWLKEVGKQTGIAETELDAIKGLEDAQKVRNNEEKELYQGEIEKRKDAHQGAMMKLGLAAQFVKNDSFLNAANAKFTDAKVSLEKLKIAQPESAELINKLILIIDQGEAKLNINNPSFEQASIFNTQQRESQQEAKKMKLEQELVHQTEIDAIHAVGSSDSLDLLSHQNSNSEAVVVDELQAQKLSAEEIFMQNTVAVGSQNAIIVALQKLGYNREAAQSLEQMVAEMVGLQKETLDEYRQQSEDLWFAHHGQVGNAFVTPLIEALQIWIAGCEDSRKKMVANVVLEMTLGVPKIFAPNVATLMGQGLYARWNGDTAAFWRNYNNIKIQVGKQLCLFDYKPESEGLLDFDKENFFHGAIMYAQICAKLAQYASYADNYFLDKIGTDSGFQRFEAYQTVRNTTAQCMGMAIQVGMLGYSAHKLAPVVSELYRYGRNYWQLGSRLPAASPLLAITLSQGLFDLSAWGYEKYWMSCGQAETNVRYYLSKKGCSGSIGAVGTGLFVASLSGPLGWLAFGICAAKTFYSVSSQSGQSDAASEALAAIIGNINFWNEKEGKLMSAVQQVEVLSIEKEKLAAILKHLEKNEQSESNDVKIAKIRCALNATLAARNEHIQTISTLVDIDGYDVKKDRFLDADKALVQIELALQEKQKAREIIQSTPATDSKKLAELALDEERLKREKMQAKEEFEAARQNFEVEATKIVDKLKTYMVFVKNYLQEIHTILTKDYKKCFGGMAWIAGQEAANVSRIIHLYHKLKSLNQSDAEAIINAQLGEDKKAVSNAEPYEEILQLTRRVKSGREGEKITLINEEYRIPAHLAWQIIIAFRFVVYVQSEKHLRNFWEKYHKYTDFIEKSASDYWWYKNREQVVASLENIVSYALQRSIMLANDSKTRDDKLMLLNNLIRDYRCCTKLWHQFLNDEFLYLGAALYHKLGKKFEMGLMLQHIPDKQAFLYSKRDPKISADILSMLDECDIAAKTRLLVCSSRLEHAVDDGMLIQHLSQLAQKEKYKEMLTFVTNCSDFDGKHYYHAYATFYASNRSDISTSLRYLIQEPNLMRLKHFESNTLPLVMRENLLSMQCWILMFDILKQSLNAIKYASLKCEQIQSIATIHTMMIVCISYIRKFPLLWAKRSIRSEIQNYELVALAYITQFVEQRLEAQKQKEEILLITEDMLKKEAFKVIEDAHACMRGERTVDLPSFVENILSELAYFIWENGSKQYYFPAAALESGDTVFQVFGTTRKEGIELLKKHVQSNHWIKQKIWGGQQRFDVIEYLLQHLERENKTTYSRAAESHLHNIQLIFSYLTTLQKPDSACFNMMGIFGALALLLEKNLEVYLASDSKELKLSHRDLFSNDFGTVKILDVYASIGGANIAKEQGNEFIGLQPMTRAVEELASSKKLSFENSKIPQARKYKAHELRQAINAYKSSIIEQYAKDLLSCGDSITPAFWGGEPELVLCAEALKVKIAVYESGKIMPIIFGNEAEKDTIRIVYNGRNHYTLYQKTLSPGVFQSSNGREDGNCLFDACLRAKKVLDSKIDLFKVKVPEKSTLDEIKVLRRMLSMRLKQRPDSQNNLIELFNSVIFSEEVLFHKLLQVVPQSSLLERALILRGLYQQLSDEEKLLFAKDHRDVMLRELFKNYGFSAEKIDDICNITEEEVEAKSRGRNVSPEIIRKEEGHSHTALTFAVDQGWYDITFGLIEKGAAWDKINSFGLSAVDYVKLYRDECPESGKGKIYTYFDQCGMLIDPNSALDGSLSEISSESRSTPSLLTRRNLDKPNGVSVKGNVNRNMFFSEKPYKPVTIQPPSYAFKKNLNKAKVD